MSYAMARTFWTSLANHNFWGFKNIDYPLPEQTFCQKHLKKIVFATDYAFIFLLLMAFYVAYFLSSNNSMEYKH